MMNRRSVLIRFSPANYDALKKWADHHGMNVTAALNAMVGQFLGVSKPNIVSVAPTTKPKTVAPPEARAWVEDDDEELNVGS